MVTRAGDRHGVGPLSLSQKKACVAVCSMSRQSRTGPMIFRATGGTAEIRPFRPMCAAHKRPNQDAALQILLKDSVAVGEGSIKTP